MAREGVQTVTHAANATEYRQKLKEKLQEEVTEFLEAETAEEVADVLEVIDAICDHLGIDRADVERIKTTKAAERGRFTKRIILDESKQ